MKRVLLGHARDDSDPFALPDDGRRPCARATGAGARTDTDTAVAGPARTRPQPRAARPETRPQPADARAGHPDRPLTRSPRHARR
jgi:hypothetical protein